MKAAITALVGGLCLSACVPDIMNTKPEVRGLEGTMELLNTPEMTYVAFLFLCMCWTISAILTNSSALDSWICLRLCFGHLSSFSFELDGTPIGIF